MGTDGDASPVRFLVARTVSFSDRLREQVGKGVHCFGDVLAAPPQVGGELTYAFQARLLHPDDTVIGWIPADLDYPVMPEESGEPHMILLFGPTPAEVPSGTLITAIGPRLTGGPSDLVQSAGSRC